LYAQDLQTIQGRGLSYQWLPYCQAQGNSTMIVYNSHETSTLIRVSGSVLPAAMKWAATAGIAAFLLKYVHINHMPDGILGDLEISSAAYSGFSFTLGFVIVFRTSQCYNRFWTCATHVNAMRAEWYEAASGLTTFIQMSEKSQEEQDMFCHKVIRYFSLMHSLALQALADGDEAFPVIDLESFPDESLKFVLESGADAEGMTAAVELTYQWIQALIVHSMTSGLLNVPPPILTRVLQQMTNGMVNYNSVLDIISIPFPFPYAQVTFVLLTFYVCFIPIVMCLLVQEAWMACVFGFLSVLCLISVDLVSTEIENPFGQDANDLPCHEFQHKMNRSLLSLLHPSAADPPELCANAKLSYEELLESQANFSANMIVMGPKFHGGKMKHPKPVEPKPPPVRRVKEAKPKAEPKAERSDGMLPPLAGGLNMSSLEITAPQPKLQASEEQESEGYAQKLIKQQAEMLSEFVQTNGAVLQRMDRTLDALSTALTQQLSTTLMPQNGQVLESRLQIRDASSRPRPDVETGTIGRARNTQAGEEVPSCLSWSSLLSRPRFIMPAGEADDPSASSPNVIVQQRRS